MSESCMTEFVCFRAVRAAGSLVTAGLGGTGRLPCSW